MFQKITLRFGSSVGESPLELNLGHIAIFVGPNNSGKSLLLREIMQAVRQGSPQQSAKILQSFVVPQFSEDQAVRLVEGRTDAAQTAQLSPGQVHLCSYDPVSGEHRAHNIHREEAMRFLINENPEYRQHALTYILSHYAMALDGSTRLRILDTRSAEGELQRPTHVLGRLFTDDALRARVRSIGFRAFGKYLVIDPTSMARLEPRLAERAPVDDLEEQALDARARAYHSSAVPLSTASDGVKAYLGMIAASYCTDHRLVLIDEPEAFLHPPLARDLGRELAQSGARTSGSTLVATHSAHFLMGCVESGATVDIVRLTYDGSAGTARVLRAPDLSGLMRDPLLRSTGMLSALFHASAVVCEGNLDRAAYEEVNRRLEEAGAPACKDAVFLSAHGKDALHRIVNPLRKLGIPAVAVADLDMVQEGALGELLKACGMPDGVWQSKRDVASRVADICRREGVALKRVGVEGAPLQVRDALRVLVRELQEWGLFLVPVGELEHWLPDLEIASRTKRGWLYGLFDKLGGDPASDEYVRPTGGDVWAFLGGIATWVADQRRSGMPI
ncbi:AAA family ATPase [uncultured Aquimonas sp.]|uniref:ATP-dependent nuclease n=1 Tax=uncultured Aquimonas sp. TaxID=385483 RepID=UPI002622F847|nr:AAA family ATPase [uncultured Aquimonas sp.]